MCGRVARGRSCAARGAGLIGFFVGGVAGLVAGSVGATIAMLPALALIDRSGVFDKHKQHRAGV